MRRVFDFDETNVGLGGYRVRGDAAAQGFAQGQFDEAFCLQRLRECGEQFANRSAVNRSNAWRGVLWPFVGHLLSAGLGSRVARISRFSQHRPEIPSTPIVE